MSFLRRQFQFAFAEIYQPEGYNPITGTLDGVEVKRILPAVFLLHPITLTAAFLGLPNRLALKKQSWANILYNFIGFDQINWVPAKASIFRKILNISEALLISTVFSVAHTIIFALKLPINILALITELLPAVGKIYFKEVAEHARRSRHPTIKTLGYHAARAAHVALTGLHFAGRAITSPLRGLISSYYEGRAFTKSLMGDKTKTKKIIGHAVGLGMGIFSALLTGTVYVVAFPVAVHFATATIAPAIANQLPSALTSALSPAVKYVYQGINWLDTSIIKNIGLGLEDTLRAIGLGISPTAAFMFGKLTIHGAEIGLKSIFGPGVEQVKRLSRGRKTLPISRNSPLYLSKGSTTEINQLLKISPRPVPTKRDAPYQIRPNTKKQCKSAENVVRINNSRFYKPLDNSIEIENAAPSRRIM